MHTSAEVTSRQPDRIILYGVSWCPDCRRARAVFRRLGVEYLDIDIDANPQAEAEVLRLNRGMRSVPTILFPDGEVLVEPSDERLEQKLNALSRHA